MQTQVTASLGSFVFCISPRGQLKCVTLFSSVSRPSWEDKNPAGICLLPPQVMGRLKEGGSWADGELQSTVPKGGTGILLTARTPGSQPGHCRCHGPRGERRAEQLGCSTPAGALAQAAGAGSGHCGGRELPLREARLHRQPQGLRRRVPGHKHARSQRSRESTRGLRRERVAKGMISPGKAG